MAGVKAGEFDKKEKKRCGGRAAMACFPAELGAHVPDSVESEVRGMVDTF